MKPVVFTARTGFPRGRRFTDTAPAADRLPVRVLDLDGGLADQTGLPVEEVVPGGAWGPRVRLACDWPTFAGFRRFVADRLPAGPAVTLYGSGDFHHVTLALLGRIAGPFNLLVLDNHPDWMRGIPPLHCGTWLRHALRLPNLRRVFHCGGTQDFDNGYRRLAPWPDLRRGRVALFPAAPFARGDWTGVPVRPLPNPAADPLGLEQAVAPYQGELADVPLYISIDKDVLVPADAATNWDAGRWGLADATAVVRQFRAAAGGRLAGADLLGDWSAVRLGTWINRTGNWIDRPGPAVPPAGAGGRNERANAEFIRALTTKHTK